VKTASEELPVMDYTESLFFRLDVDKWIGWFRHLMDNFKISLQGGSWAFLDDLGNFLWTIWG